MTYQFDKPFIIVFPNVKQVLQINGLNAILEDYYFFADKEGFEPPRYYYHYRDEIACLPVPPPVSIILLKYKFVHW